MQGEAIDIIIITIVIVTCVHYVCVSTHALGCLWRSAGKLWSQFSPVFTWILGIQLFARIIRQVFTLPAEPSHRPRRDFSMLLSNCLFVIVNDKQRLSKRDAKYSLNPIVCLMQPGILVM